MTTLDILQIGGACLALILQLIATVLTKPIRRIVPQKLWWFLFSLNFLELIRRILILCSIADVINHGSFQMVTVIMGLMISTALLLLMRELSQPKKVQATLSNLALEAEAKIKEAEKNEPSLAYNLAVHFIQSRENPPVAQQP